MGTIDASVVDDVVVVSVMVVVGYVPIVVDDDNDNFEWMYNNLVFVSNYSSVHTIVINVVVVFYFVIINDN
jgi:hypothetical protein